MLPRVFVSLPETVAMLAKHRGGDLALVDERERVTWRELDKRVAGVSRALIADGLAKGDRVAFLALSQVPAVVALLGVLRAGGVAAPLSPMLTPALAAHLIRDSGAEWMIACELLAGLADAAVAEVDQAWPARRRIALDFARPDWISVGDFVAGAPADGPSAVALEPDDLCNIIYSSGTTGVPKGIVHDHRLRTDFALGLALEFRMDQSTVNLISTPLHTNGTWMTLLPTLAVGGINVLLKRFEPARFLQLLERESVSHAFAVPTQIQALAERLENSPTDLHALKLLISAGSSMSPTLKLRATALFDGKIMELYGLTEGISTVLKPEDVAAHMATVGRPMVGVEIAVLDDADRPLPPDEVGEIVGRSAGIMRGYWNRPDATAEIVWRDDDGRLFIRTGDMGSLDHEGYLTITDRKKDMIVSGGINVFASDIEAVVLEHPDVVDVAVIAIPDPKWGETPLALVRVRPNAVDIESIRHFANARLARYQHISAIERQDDDFPRNLLGKVLKRELRAMHSGIPQAVQEN